MPVTTYPNVTIPVAPPTRFAPDQNGDPMPAGMTQAVIRIDTSQMAANRSFDVILQYDYGQGFRDDSGTTVTGGQHVIRDGSLVSYMEWQPPVPQAPHYPLAFRVAVTRCPQQVTTPAITVTLS